MNPLGQVGEKLRRTTTGWAHWCPACEQMHIYTTDNPQPNGAQWNFDGNIVVPTFTPSMKITWGKFVHPEALGEGGCCHYNLVAGVIQYCADCTHAMVNQHVPLPDLPAHLSDTWS